MYLRINNPGHDKLSVCPVCGSSKLHMEVYKWKIGDNNTVHIRCSNCSHVGGDILFDGEENYEFACEQAIAIWSVECDEKEIIDEK